MARSVLLRSTISAALTPHVNLGDSCLDVLLGSREAIRIRQQGSGIFSLPEHEHEAGMLSKCGGAPSDSADRYPRWVLRVCAV